MAEQYVRLNIRNIGKHGETLVTVRFDALNGGGVAVDTPKGPLSTILYTFFFLLLPTLKTNKFERKKN